MAAGDAEQSTGGPSPQELKTALHAFKKRLKLARLDDNSRLGGGPLTGGEKGLVAVKPPEQFSQSIWDELVKQGKLRYAGYGLYELTKS
jgi:hypothetical protein